MNLLGGVQVLIQNGAVLLPRGRMPGRFLPALVAVLAAGLTPTAAGQEHPNSSGVGPQSGGRPAPPTSTQRSFAEHWDKSEFDHRLWDNALRRHVSELGLVDYAKLRGDRDFREYVFRLSRTDAAGLADDRQRLAFWINAYNALTIRAVLDSLPADPRDWAGYRISEQQVGGKSIWKGLTFTVGGGEWTLDGIEHGILRKKRGLRDPRIHVALVCAARGCPPLWNRAYDPKHVDRQLTQAMGRFVGDRRHCRIDLAARKIEINKVFDWYASDFTNPRFTPHAGSMPAFLAEYVSDPAQAKSLATGAWRIEYLEYDWRLNLRQ